MKRYLVFTELFMPTKGGTAVWFDEVYRRLGTRDIHVVTARVPGDKEHDRSHRNTIHRLLLRRSRWLRPASLGVYIPLLAAGLRLVAVHRFQMVHAGRVLPEGLVGWVTARIARIPLVVYAHGEEITTWRRSPRRLNAMKFVYRHADRIIANSRFTRGELVGLGVDEERIMIIHPGVDTDRFTPGKSDPELRAGIGAGLGQRLILSVGRLSRRKGFDQVIRSLPRLLADGIDVHYVIIGIGEDWDYLKALACDMGLGDRVHLLGHVASDKLPKWYRTADVFAMPNRELDGDTEGFGMVFLEAAACGTPAIAGKAGGTEDAVIDCETGFRVDGTSVDDVCASLARLLKDADLAALLGTSAYRRVVAEFSWERVAEKTAVVREMQSGEFAERRDSGRGEKHGPSGAPEHEGAEMHDADRRRR